jgi:ADP-ribose pyrophosphatase
MISRSDCVPEIVYKNAVFGIEKFKFRKGGRNMDFYRMVGPNSIIILPVLDNGRILIERQYRPAIGRYLYEIPAGYVNDGEAPCDAARRELEEETGYRAGRLKALFSAYPSPGIKAEFSTCYLATRLAKTRANRDPAEIIEVRKVRLDDLVSMIKSNRIIDVKTIAAVLFYMRFIASKHNPSTSGAKITGFMQKLGQK